MSLLNFNVYLSISYFTCSVLLIIVMQVTTQSAGWRWPNSRRALGQRLTYFLVAIAMMYRVYALLEQTREVSASAMLTGVVISVGMVLLGAMRLVWPEVKPSARAVHYVSRPRGAVHCRECLFYSGEGQSCRVVEVLPEPAGQCDLATPRNPAPPPRPEGPPAS